LEWEIHELIERQEEKKKTEKERNEE